MAEGQRFEGVFRGLAPHESCASENPHRVTSCMALYHADLQAHILTEGMIALGDRIQVVEEPRSMDASS